MASQTIGSSSSSTFQSNLAPNRLVSHMACTFFLTSLLALLASTAYAMPMSEEADNNATTLVLAVTHEGWVRPIITLSGLSADLSSGDLLRGRWRCGCFRIPRQ